MKIIFFGSDDFALVSLKKLVEAEGHTVAACVMPPPRPKGRGLKTSVSPIKDFAISKNIPVFQPDSPRNSDFIKQLINFQSDLFVVIAYGYILPIEVLSIPYVCCMNVHGSLLPKYRGAAPINWAILNGEEEAGVSIIKMNAGMDSGDIFAQASLKIEPGDSSITLRAKLAELGSNVLLKTINSLDKNDYILTGQDKDKVIFAPKLTKEMGLIDWTKPAQTIHNQVRGLLPWPAAYTSLEGKTLKILKTEILVGNDNRSTPGVIGRILKDGFTVGTGSDELLIKELQPESGKPMEAKSFLSGHPLKTGTRLG